MSACGSSPDFVIVHPLVLLLLLLQLLLMVGVVVLVRLVRLGRVGLLRVRPIVSRNLSLMSGPAVKHWSSTRIGAAGVTLVTRLLLLLLLLLRVMLLTLMMMVVMVVVLPSVTFRLRDNVSKGNVVVDILVFAETDFERVVGLALQHHGADVVPWRQARIDDNVATAATRATLAANVHGVAEVTTRGAVADVVVWFFRIVVVARNGVAGFVGRGGGDDVVGGSGPAAAAVIGNGLLLMLLLLLLLLVVVMIGWRRFGPNNCCLAEWRGGERKKNVQD